MRSGAPRGASGHLPAHYHPVEPLNGCNALVNNAINSKSRAADKSCLVVRPQMTSTGVTASGDCVVIPPGIAHKLWAAPDTDLVLLCACAPAYSDGDTEMITRSGGGS